ALGLCAWQRLRWQHQAFRNPLVIAGLGLYGWMLVGWSYSNAPTSDVILHFSKYAKLALIPVFWLLLQDVRWRYRCAIGFMLAMGFVLVSAYANIFFQLPWSETQNLGWGQDHTVIGDYITQNIMMAFFAVLMLEKAVQVKAALAKVFFIVVFVLAALVITHMSYGRTGYVLLIISVGVYAINWAQGWKQWCAIAALACMIGGSLASSETVQTRVAQAVHEAQTSDAMEITSIGGRINFWKYTLEMTLQKPLQGWGTGSYHTQWCEHVNAAGWCEFGRWHPHNQYLFFWVEHGVVGLLLFLLLLASPILMTRHMAASSQRLAWCFSAIFAVNSLVNASLWSSRESHFFVLMVCLACAGFVLKPPAQSTKPSEVRA
ncbi:MAG: O-antigen ligase family protein, partial [Comamonas sp.]|nr:O-antigen ligase family protein [Candidatus Comamonas equi]